MPRRFGGRPIVADDARRTQLEEQIRQRAVEIRRLNAETARDIQELRDLHDPGSWLTFLSTLMPPH